MPEITHFIPASGSLPNDYQEVLNWRVTGKPGRVIAVQILGVLSLVIFGVIFSGLAVTLGKSPTQGEFGCTWGPDSPFGVRNPCGDRE